MTEEIRIVLPWMGVRVASDRRDPFKEAGVWPSQSSEIPPCPLATGPAARTPFAAHDWTDEDDQAERTCRRCGLPLPRPSWARPGPAPMPSESALRATIESVWGVDD